MVSSMIIESFGYVPQNATQLSNQIIMILSSYFMVNVINFGSVLKTKKKSFSIEIVWSQPIFIRSTMQLAYGFKEFRRSEWRTPSTYKYHRNRAIYCCKTVTSSASIHIIFIFVRFLPFCIWSLSSADTSINIHSKEFFFFRHSLASDGFAFIWIKFNKIVFCLVVSPTPLRAHIIFKRLL